MGPGTQARGAILVLVHSATAAALEGNADLDVLRAQDALDAVVTLGHLAMQLQVKPYGATSVLERTLHGSL